MKLSQIMTLTIMGIATFYFNVATVSSLGTTNSTSMSQLSFEGGSHMQDLRFRDTNPKVKKSLSRSLASKESDSKNKTNSNNKNKAQQKEESSDSYSLLDPNLYEGDFSGESSVLQINEITNELNR